MEEKNAKLARENSFLKASITEGMHKYEEALRKSVKAEHYGSASMRQIDAAIEEGISLLEACLASFKSIKKQIMACKKERQFVSSAPGKGHASITSISQKLRNMNVLKERNVVDNASKREIKSIKAESPLLEQINSECLYFTKSQGISDERIKLDTRSTSPIPISTAQNLNPDQPGDEPMVENINSILLQQIKHKSTGNFQNVQERSEEISKGVFIKKRKSGAKSERLRTLRVFRRTDL